MKDGTADGLGFWVGLFALIVMGTSVILFSLGRWHADVAWHHAHIAPGWAARQGVVVKAQNPDFANYDPPETPATLSFKDWYGRSVTYAGHFPYGTKVGDHTEVDVQSSGNIWINRDHDYGEPSNTDLGKGPYGILNKDRFYPLWSSILGVAGSVLLALLLGILTAYLAKRVPNPRGRLGTR